ncbi:hypothetical protein WA026_008656 [Henosepilachna vigintioctopunctata]|uniref:Uncharacterized protein n=1 Tax=Henosepilachna vigintioctopunctata TaxID=420089 RepID=A0AAW1UK70_9CUCU
MHVNSTTEILKIQVAYLKMLFEEKNARINELIKINQLLEDKIAYEVEENFKSKNSFNLKDNNDKKIARTVAAKNDTPEYHDSCIMKNKLEIRRTLTNWMKNPDTEGSATVASTDSFRAKPSKRWLYVGRAMKTVTESIVEDYIIKKCNITEKDEVEIFKSALLGKSEAFQVGIDPTHLSKISCAEFWPKGIIIRRFHFDFKKMKKEDIENEHFFSQYPNNNARLKMKENKPMKNTPITILHQNLCSIGNCKGELELVAEEEMCDVLCVTEP